MPKPLEGSKVLVTGATGFLGGRLVERLVQEEHAQVRIIVRNIARASRIAHLNVEIIHGDILNRKITAMSAQGCKFIFHCAWGDRKVNVEGTRNIFDAAVSAKVKRVVHLSTVSVYGKTSDGDLSESSPRKPIGEYEESKFEGEKLALKYHKEYNLPVIVLQPTLVYGPWSPAGTIRPLHQLKTGKVILVNGGSGSCNAVYVDDLINAMLLAVTSERAVGEVFLISGENPVTWREFYEAYEQMLGFQSTVSMTTEEIRAYREQQRRSKGAVKKVFRMLLMKIPLFARPYQSIRSASTGAIRRIIKDTPNAITGGMVQQPGEENKPIHLLSDPQIAFFQAKCRVRIDKAKHQLGYLPCFGLEHGMELTTQWMRRENML